VTELGDARTVEDLAARRAALGDAQAALVEALVAGGPMPAGFDHARGRASAEALLVKRWREVLQAWPTLRLHDEVLDAPFRDWAATHPMVAGGGSAVDGLRFLRFVRSHVAVARQWDDELGPAVCRQRAVLELLWRVDERSGRARARRGPALAVRWLVGGPVVALRRRGQVRLLGARP
jgi:hypothetical protein